MALGTVTICDLIIEAGLLILLSLSLIPDNPLSAGDKSLLAGSILALAAIRLAGRTSIINSAVGKLGLSLLVMVTVIAGGDAAWSLAIPSRTSIWVPLPTFVLFLVALAWAIKILLRKEEPAPGGEAIIPFLLSAILLIVLTVLLCAPLSAVYSLDFKTIREILFPPIAFVLLLSIISLNMVREAQIKRLTLYIMIVFAGVLLKSIL